MIDNRKARIGFEDTDKSVKIEIYGKDFEIDTNRASKLEAEEIADEKEINVLYKTIDEILGDGTVETLNNIRKENGYGEMEVNHVLPILLKIIEVYTKGMFEPLEKIERQYSDLYRKINRFERRDYRNNRNNRYRR